MGLFLCLPCLSLGAILLKNVVKGWGGRGVGKIYKGERDGHTGGLSIEGSQSISTICKHFHQNLNLEVKFQSNDFLSKRLSDCIILVSHWGN